MTTYAGTETTVPHRATGALPARLWAWAETRFGETALKSGFALVDQTVVSGTRFLATVIVGRMCGADALGVYALGFSFVFFLVVLQESLITAPYTIFGSRRSGLERQQYAGSLLVHFALLALATATVLAVVGAVLSTGLASPEMAQVVCVLAVATPFALLREFARRFAFAHLHVVTALAVDVAVAILQLGGMVLLASLGVLSAVTVFVALGAACAVAGFAWLIAHRRDFVIERQQILPESAHSWSFGKWLCGSQIVAIFSQYSIFWLLSALISTTATGIYAACATVVMLANPFILGLSNIVGPKTARVFAEGGKPELRRLVRKVTLLWGAFLSAFALTLGLAGQWIVATIYDDPLFSHQGHTVWVLAVSMVVATAGLGYGHGLKAMGRPDWTFKASLFDLTVMLVTAVPLALSLGIVGGAYCMLSGSVAGTLTRYLAFSRLARDSVELEPQ